MSNAPKVWIPFFMVLWLWIACDPSHAQENRVIRHPDGKQEYTLYPHTYDRMPDLPSPFFAKEGTEVLIARLQSGRYALVPVTVENGEPYNCRFRFYGKGRQLDVDSGDFPSLGKRGLHSERELDGKTLITGRPIWVINVIGRPGAFSGEGFLAEDEDIISVLKGDNLLVERLGLTHPDMARPLFHVWNLILKEMELGNLKRQWKNISHILYNEHEIYIELDGGKGFQDSIFHDEIQGRMNIQIWREFEQKEKDYLHEKYAGLDPGSMAELQKRLSRVQTAEMEPYYVMRYGFYEGHTGFRVDPIALAFIFGLRSLEEIEKTFEGELHEALTRHHVAQ